MKLIPNAMQNTLPDLYETESQDDPLCQLKLFLPSSQWSWYVIELSKEDNDTCYGYVEGLESELGYFSLKELESLRDSLGLRVERDSGFAPTRLSKIRQTV